MASASIASPAALQAYEPLAPYYDDLTAAYEHGRWVTALERVLRTHGLGGPRVLDVACGTGKSTLPWLRRGYDVAGCDLSPAMVSRARRRLGLSSDRVFVADMRDLPPDPRYDIASCLDDSINYLLDEADLERAIASMASVLLPGGALLFDCNSLLIYRERFVGAWEHNAGNVSFSWRGSSDAAGAPQPGGRFSAEIEIRSADNTGAPLARSVHRQRHHPRAVIESALTAAGLQVRAVFGQMTGARLAAVPDETRHPKLLYLAQRHLGDEGRPA